MKIKAGGRKTPDGYYLLVVEVENRDEAGVVERELAALGRGVVVDRAGETYLIKSKSKSLLAAVCRRLKMMKRSSPDR